MQISVPWCWRIGPPLVNLLDAAPINNWDDVDDFNWLAADKASPNWSILPEAERETFEKY